MPPAISHRLLDLLAIGRVSNLPTVWSNLLTGFLLGAAATNRFWSAILTGHVFPLRDSLPFLGLLLLATTCAYLFGTFLNDWKDAEFDREHRPERAIPSGRWGTRSILSFGIAFGLISLASFCVLMLWEPALLICGAALLGCIACYTAIHKKTPLAIIPMGLCRSLLYLLGFFLAYHPSLHDLFPDPSIPATTLPAGIRGYVPLVLGLAALGMLAYVAGLTLAARYESRPRQLAPPRIVFWLLLFLPFMTHTWSWLGISPPFLEGWHLAIPALIGIFPFLAWTLRALFVLKKSIPRFVSRSLAGLCLVDLLAYPGIVTLIHTDIGFINSYPLLLALIPLTLFVLALLLQKIAPAT